MKRLWIYALLAVFVLTGCSNRQQLPETAQTEHAAETKDVEITEEHLQAEQKSVWGLTLSVKYVSAQGLTLVCTQSGGEPSGELLTGSWYTVQQPVNGRWEQVKYTEIKEDLVGWTDEAWIIPANDTVEWRVNWSWLYDALPAGKYRIGKKFMDFRDTGDYDEAEIYVEFVIE